MINHELNVGAYTLRLYGLHNDGMTTYGLSIVRSVEGREAMMYDQPRPLFLVIRTGRNQSDNEYQAGYRHIHCMPSGITASGEIITTNGSEFQFVDTYSIWDEESSFLFSRKVTVLNAGGKEHGFESRFGLQQSGTTEVSDFNFFAPGVWYGQNANVLDGALGTRLDKHEHNYVKETRLTLPLFMMQHIESGETVTFYHKDPIARSVPEEAQFEWLIDEQLQYGSLGVRHKGGTRLDFVYPGSEGEINYVNRDVPWARRSHPINEDVRHEYTLIIRLTNEINFPDAMRDAWRYFYDRFKPDIRRVDIDKVYDASIGLLSAYAKPYEGAMGLPFTVNIPDGSIDIISYQMGFVGQQIPAGYQMIKYGLEQGNPAVLKQGLDIVDFWANNAGQESGLPQIWYDIEPGRFRNSYPIYIRIASDGMEGMLDAWTILNQHGESHPDWLSMCRSYGEWLLSNQNRDGSFYRAYQIDGTIVHEGKFNTTNPIRFLTELYSVTEDDRYLEAAVKAGNYAYEHIYEQFCYVGGTPDNDNTVDKEAGILAMYAFLALYDHMGEQKWLDAARGAADFCETWVYAWEFPIVSDQPQNVFTRAGMSGQNLIATGHSGADIFMAYTVYSYYRLYLFTGDEHYLHFSEFMLHNTKQTMDWDGKLGYKHPGLVQEVVNVSNMTYSGISQWLPWCTIAQIDPLSRLKARFGYMDIACIEKLPQQERRAKNRNLNS